MPDFINFRQPYGDQDRPKIRASLKVSRDDLESRLNLLERDLIKYSTNDFKETSQIKVMGACGGVVLGVMGLVLLWFQVRSLQKAILQTAPVSGADAKMTENIAKYATRIRELEGSNKLLRSEADKLAPLADEVVTLRQQGAGTPWDIWLKAIHGRGRSSLGKGGQLGIVLELLPDEILSLESSLRSTRSSSESKRLLKRTSHLDPDTLFWSLTKTLGIVPACWRASRGSTSKRRKHLRPISVEDDEWWFSGPVVFGG